MLLSTYASAVGKYLHWSAIKMYPEARENEIYTADDSNESSRQIALEEISRSLENEDRSNHIEERGQGTSHQSLPKNTSKNPYKMFDGRRKCSDFQRMLVNRIPFKNVFLASAHEMLNGPGDRTSLDENIPKIRSSLNNYNDHDDISSLEGKDGGKCVLVSVLEDVFVGLVEVDDPDMDRRVREVATPALIVIFSTGGNTIKEVVSRAFLQRIPRHTLSEPSGFCCICNYNFKVEDSCRRLCCGHIYHDECLRIWLERKYSCPNCRRNVLEQFLTPPTATDDVSLHSSSVQRPAENSHSQQRTASSIVQRELQQYTYLNNPDVLPFRLVRFLLRTYRPCDARAILQVTSQQNLCVAIRPSELLPPKKSNMERHAPVNNIHLPVDRPRKEETLRSSQVLHWEECEIERYAPADSSSPVQGHPRGVKLSQILQSKKSRVESRDSSIGKTSREDLDARPEELRLRYLLHRDEYEVECQPSANVDLSVRGNLREDPDVSSESKIVDCAPASAPLPEEDRPREFQNVRTGPNRLQLRIRGQVDLDFRKLMLIYGVLIMLLVYLQYC